jgi:hypothetical protein
MKTILITKFFIVMSCYNQPKDLSYKYVVKQVNDTSYTGVIHTTTKYSEGDTVKLTLNLNK